MIQKYSVDFKVIGTILKTSHAVEVVSKAIDPFSQNDGGDLLRSAAVRQLPFRPALPGLLAQTIRAPGL